MHNFMNELKNYLVLKHSNIMINLSLKQIANLSQSDQYKVWRNAWHQRENNEE